MSSLEVLRPDGTALVANNCLNTPGAATRLEPVLDQTGVHRIVVRENGQNALMPYNLVLNRVGEPVSPAATLLDPRGNP